MTFEQQCCYISPPTCGLFSINTVEIFGGTCDNLEKLADKQHSLEIPKKLGRSQICHECIKYMQILVCFLIQYHKVNSRLLGVKVLSFGRIKSYTQIFYSMRTGTANPSIVHGLTLHIIFPNDFKQKRQEVISEGELCASCIFSIFLGVLHLLHIKFFISVS